MNDIYRMKLMLCQKSNLNADVNHILPPSQIVWRFRHFTHIKKCN